MEAEVQVIGAIGVMAEWFKAPACEADVPSGTEGSNPSHYWGYPVNAPG